VETIRTALEDKSGRTAIERAHEVAAAAAVGRETFRGSKCVAGMILANQEPVPLVQRAAARLLTGDESTQRKTVAVLINRFRINYVNSLAAIRDAAYLADVSIEELKSAQVILFCRYLAEKILKTHVDQLSAETRLLFDQDLITVPLGFAILMNSNAKSPIELVEEAVRVRDRSFTAGAARVTPQHRYIHQLSEDQFQNFRDFLFKDNWVRLMKESELPDMSTSRLRTIQLPVALGSVAGGALGAVLAGPAGAAGGGALGNLAGVLIQYFAEGLAKGTLASRRVHSDHYRKLDRYLTVAVKTDIIQPFSKKVESVFQRPLNLTSKRASGSPS
jgi:hypothetical protein